ncbi:hypothetical protein CHS0354_041240 [Potamilus streckersoni]|uniref:Coiled-coil domain-containing protein 172 n=1 Tax=Potamilus streckersoni TaxID=2493646 RepID=A0AAE0SDZ7_9BIVA|nr:hypothetical protein CHS0354_041240 [Potamilus streckersoni]
MSQTETLDDLFEQIIQTERRAQERKNFLQEIRYKLQVEQKGLTEKYEEGRTLREQIDELVQKLIEEETKLKWFAKKEKILEEQRHELAKEIEFLQEQLHNEEEKAMREMTSICNDLSEFIADYGLISNGSHFREELARKHLDELKKQEDTLSNDVQKYITCQTHADKLREEKLALTEKLHTLKDEVNEGLSELEREREATRTAEKQRDTVADIQSDKQFASLQSELTEAKSKRLEERCNELQEELQQLQQQMWKRQVSSWQSHVTGHQNLQHQFTSEIDSSEEDTGINRKRPLEKETEIVEDPLVRNIFFDNSDEDDNKFDISL